MTENKNENEKNVQVKKGNNGKFFIWNIFSAIALVGVSVSVVHFFYLKYVIPRISFEQEYSITVLKETYNCMRDNFIDFVLSSLEMREPHQTMFIFEEMVEKASNCARYVRRMKKLHEFLLARKIIEKEQDEDSLLFTKRLIQEEGDNIHTNAAYCILMARILLHDATYRLETIDAETEGDILRWLALHKRIVSRNKNTRRFLKYNRALRGLLYMEEAKKAAIKSSFDTSEVIALFEKSTAEFERAIQLDHEYNGYGRNHTSRDWP